MAAIPALRRSDAVLTRDGTTHGQTCFEQAVHDPLTNVLNRRGVELLASQLFAARGRSQTALATVMMDIDYFKAVNDHFGHSAGDALLVNFAHLIGEIARSADIFGRMGGEEFLVLLPNTQHDQALALAERFRKVVEEHEFVVNGTAIHITASFGVSDYFPEDATLDKLMLCTDKALLQSKQTGRNRVSSIAPPP